MGNAAIRGVGTAMLTPFTAEGNIDEGQLKNFVNFQIEQGINFLVPCGTTGETPALSEAEQLRVMEITLTTAAGRVPVVAGCTSNNTAEVVDRGKKIRALGITHVLSASPYYNKPTQEGVYRHFKALHDETGLEILAYTVPGRTGSNILPDTIVRLAEEKIIFAVKEASGDIIQIQKICQQCSDDTLTVLSGDDAMTQPLMAVGGKGIVSVTSNIVPKAMRAWVDSMTERNLVKARQLLQPLLPLFEACFVESNPIPVKYGASLLGLMDANYRLPIVPPSSATQARMKEALKPFMA